MTVSIIICTRNRAGSLPATLESINQAAVPSGWTIELILVDNNSTDNTLAVVREAHLDHVALRCVSESMVGLSNARNTGISHAQGEIIMATDDDVRVPVNWIEGMCDPIIQGRADATAGGIVYPPHLEAALKLLPIEGRRAWFGATGNELDSQSPGRLIGANMAFHRRVLDKVPGFDVELGAGALGYGEETLFSFELLAAGYILSGALEVAVEHHFDLDRLTEANLISMARKMGRSDAFITHHWHHRKVLRNIPLSISRRLRLGWLRRFAMGNNRGAARNLAEVLALEENLAFFREYAVQRKRPWKYSPREIAPANS